MSIAVRANLMSKILIDFLDFPDLAKADNPFLEILRRRYHPVATDFPDYLVYTHEGDRHRLYSCTKIFYTQECFTPDWKECDYAITSVKVDDPRAYHLPFYSLWRPSGPLIRAGNEDYRSLLKEKTGFCSFLTGYVDKSVRNRVEFFEKLHARKPVDSAGRGVNNTGYTIAVTEKPGFLRRYKFHIAYENADIPGWTTEKFTDALAAHTVPIFWGDITVKDQFNPEAFIDRRDFDSDESCIEHVLKVDQDDKLYLKYLSAPPFRDNRINKEWDHDRLLDFFDRIFTTPPNPVAGRNWWYNFTKWRLVRRVKTHQEKGWPSPAERVTERTRGGSND
jgi:hypothetical protein